MPSKKPNKKKTAAVTAPKPIDPPPSVTAPEEMPTIDPPVPETIPQPPERGSVLPDTPPPTSATEELLFIAIAAWRFHHFQPLFYRMTRTWSHHKLKEEYGTHIIYEQLMKMNGGDHEGLLTEIEEFSDTLMRELKPWLARKAHTK